MEKYAKILTKNDTGETGGHQAGIAVPKSNKELLSFFPALNSSEFNPDHWITCIDDDGEEWQFRYIYYNGKTFSPAKSTRNEYRMTHMTKFFSKWNAKSEDKLIFAITDSQAVYYVSLNKDAVSEESSFSEGRSPVVLRGWNRVY
tara:strand:- start:136 stop:570 length:435 start_codon:yes stop_codon:yes gene_type:complete